MEAVSFPCEAMRNAVVYGKVRYGLGRGETAVAKTWVVVNLALMSLVGLHPMNESWKLLRACSAFPVQSSPELCPELHPCLHLAKVKLSGG